MSRHLHAAFKMMQYLDLGENLYINLYSVSHMQDFPKNGVLKVFTFGSPVDQFGSHLGIELKGKQRETMLKFVSAIDIDMDEQEEVEKEAAADGDIDFQSDKEPIINPLN